MSLQAVQKVHLLQADFYFPTNILLFLLILALTTVLQCRRKGLSIVINCSCTVSILPSAPLISPSQRLDKHFGYWGLNTFVFPSHRTLQRHKYHFNKGTIIFVLVCLCVHVPCIFMFVMLSCLTKGVSNMFLDSMYMCVSMSRNMHHVSSYQFKCWQVCACMCLQKMHDVTVCVCA